MSQENVEVVRAIYENWMRGDFEAVFAVFDQEVEWFPPPDDPGAGEQRGHQGVRRSLAEWIRNWDDYRFELRQLIDYGDDVLAEGWQRGRGRSSGVDVSGEIFSVWTLRAGQVVRQRMFRDRAQALEAVGLRE
jgi:ketosteroid isomerase-like protein